jgi:hypothetical protein
MKPPELRLFTDNRDALVIVEAEPRPARTVAVMRRGGAVWDISILTVQGTWERTSRPAPDESEGFQAFFSLVDFVRQWPIGTTKGAWVSIGTYEHVLLHASHWYRVDGPISKEERHARIKKIWAEAPRAMAPVIVKMFKREVYEENRPRWELDWRELYPEHVRTFEIWFSNDTKDPCVDNYRVADASNRRHRRVYWRQARRGCCGSRDTTITVGGKTYLIGYNYGH